MHDIFASRQAYSRHLIENIGLIKSKVNFADDLTKRHGEKVQFLTLCSPHTLTTASKTTFYGEIRNAAKFVFSIDREAILLRSHAIIFVQVASQLACIRVLFKQFVHFLFSSSARLVRVLNYPFFYLLGSLVCTFIFTLNFFLLISCLLYSVFPQLYRRGSVGYDLLHLIYRIIYNIVAWLEAKMLSCTLL